MTRLYSCVDLCIMISLGFYIYRKKKHLFIYSKSMCITFFCLYPFRTKNLLNSLSHKTVDEKHTQKNQSALSDKNPLQQVSTDIQGTQQIQFIIAFNRDQQIYRKTVAFGPFEQDPNIYAGRDTVSTGTWLGINIKTGIMVILTNYDIPIFRKGKSRGQLVKNFLNSNFVPNKSQPTHQILDKLISQRLTGILEECNQVLYPPFNLIVYNIRADKIYYICSETKMKQPFILKENQIYGLCNTDLFTLWPKTKHGLNLFEKTLVEVKDNKDAQIFDKLINAVMKDKKQFSQNLNDEASIFIEPFFSTLENAQRMTKSTFVAVIRKRKREDGKFETDIVMREVTHENSKMVKEQQDKKSIKEQNKKPEDYDHHKQIVVEYQLKL